VLTDTDASFLMGAGDPNGRYCRLMEAGDTFTDGRFAIPFSRSTTPDVLDALNALMVTAVTYGDYAVGTGLGTFGVDRGVCAAFIAQQNALAFSYDLQPLSFQQLSGIFFVLVRGG
jgi:hypothetical protein